jgi:hypothetical protein
MLDIETSMLYITREVVMDPENIKSSSDTRSRWPVCEMLMRGTFGTKTPAERRLVRRARSILIVFYAIAITGIFRPKLITPAALMFLAAAFITYYAWEKRKYFHSLDELARRIELEGMAWAYAIGALATLWLAAIAYAASPHWTLHSKFFPWGPILLFGVMMASVKGAYRYIATRRY